MASIDKLEPGGALGLGALLSAVNPKNAALTIAAAATIAGAGLPGEQAVVLAVFVLIGSVGVLAPLVVYLFAGAGAAGPSTAGRHGPPPTTRPCWLSCSWSSASSRR